MTYIKQVPAAERTLKLLEILAAAPQGLSAGELAERMEITRSSLFALLNTLKARHYLEQTETRRYRPGPALFQLLPARQRTRQTLIDAFLADAELNLLPETLSLTQLEGTDTVVIAQQESRRPVRAVLPVGQRRPAFANADGRVLLAGLPAEAAAAVPGDVADGFPAIRRRGLAQTRTDELVELACPICPDGYRPDTALLLTVPAFRWHDDEATERTLQQAAARLSYRLGAAVYQPYGQALSPAIEPTSPLAPTELAHFLKGAWGGRLACVRPDGAPHVVPLWYEWDGVSIWLTASPSAAWGDYIRANREVALTIDEPWPPLRRVLIFGEAQPVTEAAISGGVAGLRARLVARYLGQQAAAAPVEFEGWTAFKIAPKKIIGQQGLSQ